MTEERRLSDPDTTMGVMTSMLERRLHMAAAVGRNKLKVREVELAMALDPGLGESLEIELMEDDHGTR